MSEIRAVEERDLPEVMAVYECAMRSGGRTPPPGLKPYFKRLFEHPWADPELPSLVFVAGDGRILGFIGSHVRRVLIDGRRIRMRCGGQFVSDPRERHLGIGARLLRSYLSGPQDLTITDGAETTVHEMWVRFGGSALFPGSITWTRLLRPLRAAGDHYLHRKGLRRMRRVMRLAWPLFDAPTSRLFAVAERPADVHAEELTPRAMITHLPAVLDNARLCVDYDERFLEWLFREMAAVSSRGTLVRHLLWRGENLLGWYVAYIKPRGISNVIQIMATRSGLETVLDCLFAEAWNGGSGALEGRLEPALYEPLYRRRCLLRYGTRALFHSRDQEVAAAISFGGSSLSRLDGDWWMGHHIEPFHSSA